LTYSTFEALLVSKPYPPALEPVAFVSNPYPPAVSK